MNMHCRAVALAASARAAIFVDLYNAILALLIIEGMPYVIPTAPDDSGEEFTHRGFQAIWPARSLM